MNLVTGATGLLGTHITLHLLRQGRHVIALRRSESKQECMRNVFRFYGEEKLFERIEWVEGDVMDVDSLIPVIRRCNYIYHSAAIVSYHKSDRKRMYHVNVDGTANVVNASLLDEGKKLCYISSIAAFGKSGKNQLVDEQTEWTKSSHNTHYGITKHLAELEVYRGIQEGLQAVIINPGLIIGPGDFNRSSGTIFPRVDKGIPFFPPGGTGFVSATDAANVAITLTESDQHAQNFIVVAESLSMKDVFGQVATALGKTPPGSIAPGYLLNAYRILEWLREIFTGKKALVTKESLRNASIHIRYDNSKVVKITGINFRSVKEAIIETAAFYRKDKNC